MTRSKPKSMLNEQGEVRELTASDLKKFRPASEALPASLKAKLGVRGRQKSPVKQRVTIRLNHETVDFFRETGRGWQSRLDEVITSVVGLSTTEKPHSRSAFEAYFAAMAEVVAARHVIETSAHAAETFVKVLHIEQPWLASAEKFVGWMESMTKHDMVVLLSAQREMLQSCKSLLESDPYIDKALLTAASGVPNPESLFLEDDDGLRNLADKLRGMASLLDQVAEDKQSA